MKYILPILICLSTFNVNAQVSTRDSSIKIPSFGIGYKPLIPLADLANKTNFVHSIAPEFCLKLKNNIFFKGQFNILLTTGVKEDSLLQEINTEVGWPISTEGFLVPITTSLNGYMIQASVGKVFSSSKINPNSGLSIDFGLGFIQHKINYKYDGDVLPQIEGEYLKGYDRLTNGISFSQGIGLMRYSNNNYLSYYIGLTAIEAFTKNRRDFNFDSQEKDDSQRLDIMIGLDFRVLLPILPKTRY